MKWFFAIAALALLSACDNMWEPERLPCIVFCYEEMDVQLDYVEARDDCQGLAEKKISLYENPNRPPPEEKERNAMLLALFSQCMHAKDWGVTAPQREVGETGPVPNHPIPNQPSPGPYAQVPGQAAGNETQQAPMVGVGMGPGFSSPSTPAGTTYDNRDF